MGMVLKITTFLSTPLLLCYYVFIIATASIDVAIMETIHFYFFIVKEEKMMDANQIKQILKEKRIYQWEVAKALGITEFTLTRWLRDDLPADKAEQIMQAIDTLLLSRNKEVR